MKKHLFCVGVEFRKASDETGSYAYLTAYLGADDLHEAIDRVQKQLEKKAIKYCSFVVAGLSMPIVMMVSAQLKKVMLPLKQTYCSTMKSIMANCSNGQSTMAMNTE